MNNTQAEIYSKKKWGKFKRWLKSVKRSNRILLDFFDENLNGRLLDIGAWDGSLEKLLPSTVNYYPVDIVKIKHPNATCVDLNKKKLPFPNKFFDYVFADQVLEHLFYPFEICKEIHRVLKDDGIALIGLPNDEGLMARIDFIYRKYESIKNQEFFHHWNFTFENSKEFLNKCGFKILKHAGRFGITSPIMTWVAPIVFFKVKKNV